MPQKHLSFGTSSGNSESVTILESGGSQTPVPFTFWDHSIFRKHFKITIGIMPIFLGPIKQLATINCCHDITVTLTYAISND